MKKLIDVSYHGSHYHLSSQGYLKKSESNIKYATYLRNKYAVVFIFHSKIKDRIQKDGITYRFRKKKWNSKFLLPFRVSWVIKIICPDVVLVHSILYIHFAVFLRLLLPKDTVILIQNHGESPPVSYIKSRLIQYCDRYINGYLFTAKSMGIPWLDSNLIATSDKVFEVMEGSTDFVQKDKAVCKAELGLSMTKPIFLWVGRLDVNKDPMCVLEALKTYKNSNNIFEFYMFYHTTELLPTIKEFIIANDLTGCVFLKGNSKHEALEQWYSAADYFISASHKEGSGYALCEAMACGCIPIVSNIPSFEYMTKKGYAGLLFDKGSSDSLVENLIQTKDLNKEKYSIRVNEVFQERLSFEAIASGINSIINNFLVKK